MSLPQLRRVRWAVRASLVLGVAASVCANVLHARNNPISQAIAAWPPLALLITVELISRVPLHRRHLAAIRVLATGAIAGIAAWVSYWHMAGVTARYGEQGSVPYLLPLSVDGLIVVASVSLVELAGKIRVLETPEPQAVPQPAPQTVPQPAPQAAPQAAPQPAPQAGPGSAPQTVRQPVPRRGAPSSQRAAQAPPQRAAQAPDPVVDEAMGPTTSGTGTDGVLKVTRVPPPRATRSKATSTRATGGQPQSPRRGRPVAETRALAAQLAAQQPDATHDDLARQLGISTKRLRTVLAGSGVQ